MVSGAVARRSGGGLATTLVATISFSPPHLFFYFFLLLSHRRRDQMEKFILQELIGAPKNLGEAPFQSLLAILGPLTTILYF